MQAVFYIQLPFRLTIPVGLQFHQYETERNGYRIRHEVPRVSDIPDTQQVEMRVDGVATVRADLLVIRFIASEFVREQGADMDPPASLVAEEVDGFLSRLKYVTKSASVVSIEFPQCVWHLDYLDDDGNQLAPIEGLLRARGGRAFSFSYIVCTAETWGSVFDLPPTFRVPEWQTMLIDAAGALPHVGTSLVLAATALEIFIDEILRELANTSPLQSIWNWVTKRESHLQEPSLDEKYSVLLNHFVGHSLKEDGALWTARKHLATARNRFVHTGTARIGDTIVDSQLASRLISQAQEVVLKVREWLPPHLQWPLVDAQNVEVQFTARVAIAPKEGAAQSPGHLEK